jgi:carbamoyl-phosphate synthase large subunit
MIKNDQVNFIINTVEGERAYGDSFAIRRSAMQHKVCYTTTLAGGKAACVALQHNGEISVIRIQDLHYRVEEKKRATTSNDC